MECDTVYEKKQINRQYLRNTLTIVIPCVVFGTIMSVFCGYAFAGTFNIFLARQFINTIPKELDEAAAIDEAGDMRTLIIILVPAIRFEGIVMTGMKNLR